MLKKLGYIFIVFFGFAGYACANGTDNTFSELYNTLNGYLTGSLGSVILIICLLAIVVALAGFAKMTVLFTALVVAMIIHWGPNIISSMAGTSAETVANSCGGVGMSELIQLVLSIGLGYLFIQNRKLKQKVSQKN